MRPTKDSPSNAQLLQVHAVIPSILDIMGPGRRMVVWVQGCSIHCSGCLMPEAWDPYGGMEMDLVEMCESYLNPEVVEGITVSGGEPFEQAGGLATLLGLAKAKGCSTWVYTGYTIENLINRRDHDIDLALSLTDVLVDGEFRVGEGDSGHFRGSPNQRIISLTGAIPPERIKVSPPDFELTLDSGDRIMLVGMPPRGFFKAFRETLVSRGIEVYGNHFSEMERPTTCNGQSGGTI